jgi:hypothetical protein
MPGSGSAKKLPSFLAMHIFCRDDNVRPFERLLDLRRVNPMPGNMAHIVHIPIEAFCITRPQFQYIQLLYIHQ